MKKAARSLERVSTYDLLLATDHVLRLCHSPLGLTAFREGHGDVSAAGAESGSESSFSAKSTLVVVSDNGSDANAARWFCLHHLKLRALFLYDPRHKCHRILANAMTKCGYASAAGYAKVLISWTRGPWDNRKWFRVLAEESVELLKMVGDAHEHSDGVSVIKFMLPKIAADRNMVEHDVSVRTAVGWLREANFYKKQAATGNPSRWDEFHSTWRALRPEIGLLTVVLLSYGFKNGLIKMEGGKPAVTESLVRAAEQAGVHENLKAGQKERRVIFSKFKNKLQAVLYLLLDNDLLASVNTWFAVSNPVSEYLNEMRREVRGRQGSWQFWQKQAQGEWRKTLNKIGNACVDPCCHRSIGISDNTELAGSLFYFRLNTEDGTVQYQDWLFERMVHYALSVMKHMCLYESLCSFFSSRIFIRP